MTNQKKFNKFELFCVAFKILEMKIENHTLDEIFESVDANNDDGIHRLFIHFKDSNYCCSLDADRIYELYKDSNYDLFKAMRILIDSAQKQYYKFKSVASKSDKAKDIIDIHNIYVQIMPDNEEYFSDKISMPLNFDNNLKILFRCYLNHGRDGISSIPITKEIYDLYFNKYSMNELLDIAMTNTKRLFPLQTTRISYVMEIALTQNGYSSKEIQNYISKCSKHDFLYMVKTDANLYGANVFLFTDVMKEFAKNLGCSFFILPGSTREVYFVSEKNSVKDNWLDTIKGANQIAPEDFLSDHLYYFDINTGKISIYK